MALQMDIIIAISMADPKEEKWKYIAPTKYEVSWSMTPLITMEKRPRVKILIGSDSIHKMGLTKTFKHAKIKLAKRATQILET